MPIFNTSILAKWLNYSFCLFSFPLSLLSSVQFHLQGKTCLNRSKILIWFQILKMIIKKKTFQETIARRSQTLPNLSKIRNSLDISSKNDDSTKSDLSTKNSSTVSLQRKPKKPSRSTIDGSSASVIYMVKKSSTIKILLGGF